MQTSSKLSSLPVALTTASAASLVQTEVSVSVEHVSKRYRLREGSQGLGNQLRQVGRKVLGRAARDASDDYFYAVNDVSFQVRPGEALGLVGHNGAGKTTMLRLLSRITRPTSGAIKLHGRSSSLIELGAGFHPDLTGRDNVELNGVILGLSRHEIKKKFDDIVAFAEMERFIDMPVKRYSSGMYARLGFAVAAHVNPDIMFIDEVLAVGDASFQRRCYDFIHAFVKSGKTTVFVSHNLYVIEQLCDRVAWMERGEVVKTGTPSQVLPAYLDNQDQKALAATAKLEQMHASSSADDVSNVLNESHLRLSSVTFTDGAGVQKETFHYGEDVVIQARYHASEPIEQPHFVFGLVDAEGGRPLFLASMLVDGNAPAMIQGDGVIKCVFKNVPLLPRAYYAWGEVWAADRAKALLRWQRLSGFRIVDNNENEMGRGSIRHTRADAPIRVPYTWEF